MVDAVLVQWFHNNLFGRRQLFVLHVSSYIRAALEGRDMKHQDVKVGGGVHSDGLREFRSCQ